MLCSSIPMCGHCLVCPLSNNSQFMVKSHCWGFPLTSPLLFWLLFCGTSLPISCSHWKSLHSLPLGCACALCIKCWWTHLVVISLSFCHTISVMCYDSVWQSYVKLIWILFLWYFSFFIILMVFCTYQPILCKKMVVKRCFLNLFLIFQYIHVFHVVKINWKTDAWCCRFVLKVIFLSNRNPGHLTAGWWFHSLFFCCWFFFLLLGCVKVAVKQK